MGRGQSHGVEQDEGPAEVVVVVLEGLGDRLANSLVPGEMDDGADRVALEDLAERIAIAQVRLVKLGLPPPRA